jgi:hypothetical protein
VPYEEDVRLKPVPIKNLPPTQQATAERLRRLAQKSRNATQNRIATFQQLDEERRDRR